jgi:hypothetical protein
MSDTESIAISVAAILLSVLNMVGIYWARKEHAKLVQWLQKERRR